MPRRRYTEDEMIDTALKLREELGNVIERDRTFTFEDFNRARNRLNGRGVKVIMTRQPDQLAELYDLICSV